MSQEARKKHLGAGRNSIDVGATMPFLRILQSNAAEVNPADPNYEMKKIEGAKPGDIFHPSLGILNRPLRFVPTHSISYYEERDGTASNSRIIAVHNLSITQDPTYKKEGILETIEREVAGENGKTFISTHRLMFSNAWGIILPDYNNATAVLKFSSTFLKYARLLRDTISRFRYADDPQAKEGLPPVYARSFMLNTKPEKNDKGVWMSLVITPDKVLDDTNPTHLKVMDLAYDLVDKPLLPPTKNQAQLEGETTEETE